jgi:hypothetical protein
MDFEWDPDKREANLRRHGVDFVDAAEVFAQPHLAMPSPRGEEEREVAIGLLPARGVPEAWSGRLSTVVYVRRVGAIRIISARRARKNERDAYREALLGGD